MCVCQVAEREVTLHFLHKVESLATAKLVDCEAQRCDHMISDKQQRKWPRRHWHSNPLDPVWDGIIEANGEDRDVVLLTHAFHQLSMTTTDRIRRLDIIIENGDTHQLPVILTITGRLPGSWWQSFTFAVPGQSPP